MQLIWGKHMLSYACCLLLFTANLPGLGCWRSSIHRRFLDCFLLLLNLNSKIMAFTKLLLLVLTVTCYFANSAKAQDCNTCEMVIGAIESWIESNYTETEIIQLLEDVCSLVPQFETMVSSGNFHNFIMPLYVILLYSHCKCDTLVEVGIAEVIQWIKQSEDPQTVCSQLGLCSSKANVHTPSSSGDCDVCETVIATIESWLASEATQKEIIQYLETVCELIPSWESVVSNIWYIVLLVTLIPVWCHSGARSPYSYRLDWSCRKCHCCLHTTWHVSWGNNN